MAQNRKPPPGGGAAALESLGLGQRQQDNRHSPEIQLSASRLRYLAERIHALGARVLFELLLEQLRQGGDLAARIEDYARIDPAHLVITGGDRFPARLSALDGGRK